MDIEKLGVQQESYSVFWQSCSAYFNGIANKSYKHDSLRNATKYGTQNVSPLWFTYKKM